jgi:formylglycine-generating enzyme required for sulfatase activity
MEFSTAQVHKPRLSRLAGFSTLLFALSICLLIAPLARGSEVSENPFDPLILGSVESPASGQAEFTFASQAVSNAYVKLSGGRLEKSHPETFANEAQIVVTPWDVQFNPFGNTQTYSDSIAIPDWYFPFPADAAGNHLGQQALQFVETYRDFSAGADQTWKDLQIQLVQMNPIPGQYGIGPLPADGYPDGYAAPGSTGNNQHSLAAMPDTEFGPGDSVVDRFTFSHTGVPAGSSASLVIKTQKFNAPGIEKATVLFLYNSEGELVAYDESPNNHNVGTVIITEFRDSLLEFNGDNPLPAGTYTLVVAGAGANANLNGVTIDTDLLGTGAVDYQIGIETSGLSDACSAERIVALLTTWHMLSTPCQAPAGTTMADLVAYDESRDATAADSWVAFVYEAGGYVPLAADSPIPDPGVGFWFNTTEAVNLRLPGGSTPTDNCSDNVSSGDECGAIDFPEANWSLLGNALDSPVGYADLNAYNFSASGCYPNGCAIDELHNQNASMQLWVYDHYRGSYVAFAQDQQKVVMPWDGYWARIDVAAPLYSEWTLSMPAFAVPIPQMVDIPLPEPEFRHRCFEMGSPPDEAGRREDEDLQQICLDFVGESAQFGASKYEVTFDEYDAFVSTNPTAIVLREDSRNGDHLDTFIVVWEEPVRSPSDNGWGRGKHPVIGVSWYDAVSYADWLSQLTGLRFALPTEAQWEYLARGGTSTAFHTGQSITDIQANIDASQSLPVGQYAANAYGLHDVHGNASEWTCSLYVLSHLEDVCFPVEQGNVFDDLIELELVQRGGRWSDPAAVARSASRNKVVMEYRPTAGVRLIRY